MSERRRYHLNIVGDFYVEDGCCTMCGVPQALAPDLFAEGLDHCYVRKQPTEPAEIARMLEVLYSQELGCIRYAGKNLDILKTIHSWGDTFGIVDTPRWVQLLARIIGRKIPDRSRG